MTKLVSYIEMLPASLIDDSATMNDRTKHKQVTGKINHQTAKPRANPSAKAKEPFFANALILTTTINRLRNAAN